MADGSVTIDARLALDELKKDLKNLKSAINSSLPSASKSLNALGDGFEKVGKLATSAGKACSVVTGAITGIFTAAGLKAKNFITTYEGAINLFKKKLGDTGAKEMYNSLLTIAKNSTFAQESLVSTGQTMVAMGIDGSRTAKYMQLVTDAVAGMGGSGADIEMLGTAIGKMSNQVSLHTDDLNQLATQGLPVWDVLAKKYGKTKEAVQEMASKGMLPATETLDFLSNALEGNIAGFEQWSVAGNAISQKGGTLKGALDGLNSSVRSLGLNLLGLNIHTGQTGNYQSLIQVVSLVGSTIENVGKKFSFVSDWIGTCLDKVKLVLENFNKTLDEMSPGQLESIAKAIAGLVVAGPALLGLGKGFNVIGGAFKGLSGMAGIVENAFTGITSIGSKVSGTANSLLNFAKNSDTLKKRLGALSILGVMNANMALDTFKNKFPTITAGFTNMGNKVSNFTSIFTSKISPLTSTISSFASRFGITSSKVGDFCKSTLLGFGTLSKGITKSLMGIAPAILKAFSFGAVLGLIVAGLGVIQGQFGDKISEIANKMIIEGPTIINNLVNGIVIALPNLINQGTQLVQTFLNVIIANLPTILHGGMQIILGLVNGISAALPTLIPQGFIIITQLIQTIVANLPLIIQAGVQMLCTLVNGIAQQLPTLIPMAFEIILTLVDSLLNNIDKLIDAGINLIISLAEGLINALPRLIEKAPIIISKLITAICNNFPKILATGVDLIIKLAVGLIQAIPQLVSKIPQIITAIVNGLKEGMSNIVEVGKNMIEGIWNGIRNAKDWLLDKVKDWCGSVLDGIKGFFGIHSPSTVFRDEVGKFLALGVGEGFEKNIGAVYKKMKASVDFETQKISANISATNDLRTAKGNSQTITNNNDNGILVNNNFYEKVQSPHETAKATKNALRRAAYAK